jgi:DHA1 family tetracycline resistance protein-like MFS transporter
MNIKKYTPIILLNFVNIIGFTLLIPILPQISESLTNKTVAPIIYGVLISSYALCQFLGAPLLGSLSDKYGRRPLLFVSQLGTTLSWVIFGSAYFIDTESKFMGISLALIVIAFSRITDGLTGGNISVANAWISDITAKEDKAKIFGLMGAVFGIGFLLSPSIGGLSYNAFGLGYLSTAIVAFMISLITLFQIVFFLPESLPQSKRDKTIEVHLKKEFNIWKQFKAFEHSRLISNLLKLRLVFTFVFASYTTLITLLLTTNYGLATTQVGLLLSVIGIFSIFNQGFLIRKLVHKYGDFHILFSSIVVLMVGIIMATFMNPMVLNFGETMNIILFMINCYIINLGISMAMPTFKSVLTNNVDETKQGRIAGLDESLLALGNGLSPIIAGTLFSLISNFTFVIYFFILLIPYILLKKKIEHARHKESMDL